MRTHGTFATAVNCMDGRVQEPVTQWIKTRFQDVDFVDTLTDAGTDGALAHADASTSEWYRRRIVDISVGKHGSKVVIIAGHADCAGNPVSDEQHRRDITEAMRTVQSWNTPIQHIIGLWVATNEAGTWQVQVVAEMPT